MEKRLNIMLVIAVLGALLLAEAVFADPTAPMAIATGESSRRDLTTLPTQTVDAQAGNVTQINLTALSITKGWQGFYGNVSGTIVLQNAANQTFYNWTVTNNTGEVYATRAAAITWTSVVCADAAAVTTEEAALNMVATDADSVSNTYSGSKSHPSFNVASVSIGADDCMATNAYDDTGAQTTKFFQVLLNQGANIIYATLMNSTKVGFDTQGWDFELLVGEDGHGAAASSVTQYYFWVELN